MIQFFKRTLKDHYLKKTSQFTKGCWINCTDPNAEELKLLENDFTLDHDQLESALDRYEIPRIELEDDVTYIFMKVLTSSNSNGLETLMIAISPTYILTLSRHKPLFVDYFIKGDIKFITTQKLKSLLNIFSLINDSYERTTLRIVRSVNSKKDAISTLKSKDIQSLLDHEGLLNSLISSYNYSYLVYTRVKKQLKFYDDDKEIIEDLILEAQQGLDLCRMSLKTISTIRQHFEILLSHKLNRSITLLTIFTVFMSIPAAISGFYGMNIPLPFQRNVFTLYGILFIVVAIWVLLYYFFKRKSFF